MQILDDLSLNSIKLFSHFLALSAACFLEFSTQIIDDFKQIFLRRLKMYVVRLLLTLPKPSNNNKSKKRSDDCNKNGDRCIHTFFPINIAHAFCTDACAISSSVTPFIYSNLS